jgi:hypothetical protein
MSRLLSPPIPYTSRPTLVDYWLLLLGCGLSLYLIRTGPMPAEADDSRTDPVLREFVAALPDMMRLPEGVLLLWPVFLALQRVRGRKLGLTFGEWLWVLAWLGTALLAGLSAWQKWGVLPEFVQPYAAKPRVVWYVVVMPSMAALAGVMALGGLLRRIPAPWTHSCGLALVIWPVAPLSGILLWGKFV